MAKKDTPVEKVEQLRRRGLTKDEIIKDLESEGYNYQQIYDAFDQVDLKDNVKSYPQYQYSGEEQDSRIEQLEEAAPSPSSKPNKDVKFSKPSRDDNFQDFRPSQPLPQQRIQKTNQEEIEALIESIVKEKWDDMVGEIGDLSLWKESVRNDISSLKQGLLRLENRFQSLQQTIIGKVQDYNKSIQEVGSDLNALEDVLKKIITPLSVNVKELNKITEELKKSKKK